MLLQDAGRVEVADRIFKTVFYSLCLAGIRNGADDVR
jgi:hypothetical protein